MHTIELDRDLVFLDVETTGLHVLRDRIIQLACIKLHADGSPDQTWSKLINPEMTVSPEAISVHGITQEQLEKEPTFQHYAQEIFAFIGDADLGGYNCARFDIPMLMEEFARAGINFIIDQRRIIDVQRIFYKMEPRTLKAAYQFYCNQELINAHDALVDVQATIDVFRGQLTKYIGMKVVDEEGKEIDSPIQNNIQSLHDFTNDLRSPDVTQKLKYDEQGNILFNFGKYQGKKLTEVFQIEPSYYHWIMNKEFSSQVKQIASKIFQELKANT